MASLKNPKKDEHRSAFLRKYNIPPKTRGVFLLDLTDESIKRFLMDVGERLGFHLFDAKNLGDESLLAFDAIISDGNGNIDIVEAVKLGITPILPKENAFSDTFTEFDPMKFSGNSFLFEEVEAYHILEKILRYLENIRYPGDRNTLAKNLRDTF